MYSAVSPYPNTALAAWQLVLIAVVALGGVAFWLGAVYLAAREPRGASSLPATEGPASTEEAESKREQHAVA